jgi:WD40 repeat protein/class 3 adenylate cyclase/GTPase SAR1 family protein
MKDPATMDSDEEKSRKLPPGVKLVRTLRGHTGRIGRIAWSPDGRMLASPSDDHTVRLWDAETGECLHTLLRNLGRSVAFDPAGRTLASAGAGAIGLWDMGSLDQRKSLPMGYGHDIAWAPDGRTIATPDKGEDKDVTVWDVETGEVVKRLDVPDTLNSASWSVSSGVLALAGDSGNVLLFDRQLDPIGSIKGLQSVHCTAWSPDGRILAISGLSLEISLWEVPTLKKIAVLEGHTDFVVSLSFSGDGSLLASKSDDDSIRLWRYRDLEAVAVLEEKAAGGPRPFRGLAFHPRLPLLATVGSDPGTPKKERDRIIHIWELDLTALLGQVAEPSAHYLNAKVVLVGDTGVGKSGLSLVLNRQPFEATDSTPGRRVWTFDSQEVSTPSSILQTRETLLWDLAGQPGYRIIHQLHLNEVTVALVVFDARSETDPLAGVRHWARALRLAQQRQGSMGVPMKRFLVSARNDRGGVAIGEERLQAVLKGFSFDGYFKTSAKEGWGIEALRAAIEQSIAWESLPVVASSQLFADIKSFLVEVKTTGRLLAPTGQLYDEFVHEHPDTAGRVADLRSQFDTCIGRLENRDLIRRLTFGGYVLLQPELLDAYGSAMVNGAKQEPDGLGSLAEEITLAGKFYVPKEQKVADPDQEQLLLHATVEELVRHDLALRENADDGRYLVFPSQFNRDYEDASEPKGKAVAITFDGPVQSLYSTLVVRLGHSGLFTTGRAEIWRNAAVFTAKAGGKCGLLVHEFAEGRGRLLLFFPDADASMETRYHFEEFVLAHAQRRALDGSLELVRFFICADCSLPVPDAYVSLLRDRGALVFPCPCGGTVSLAEPKERMRFRSRVEAMDRSANEQRNFDAFIMSAKGETSTRSFQDWAGAEHVTLAIMFTDVVGSTALGEEIQDEAMNEVRRAHFAQSRRLIDRFQGREIKTIGDSFMTAFKDVGSALDYARELQANTGHPQVKIRAGIHIGLMHVEEGDVFGGTVNFAARVVGAIKGAEIWLSDRAKDDISRLGARRHKHLTWEQHEGVAMKGFPGKFTLWSIR